VLGRPLTWRNRQLKATDYRDLVLLQQLPFSYAVSVCPRAGPNGIFLYEAFSFAFCLTWRFPPPDERLNMCARCRAASSSFPESPLSASSFGVLFVWPRALIHLVSCAAVAAGGGRVRPDDGGGHRRGGAPRALHHRCRGGAAVARSRRGAAGPLVSIKPAAAP
jgi:hypothetical protein